MSLITLGNAMDGWHKKAHTRNETNSNLVALEIKISSFRQKKSILTLASSFYTIKRLLFSLFFILFIFYS